MLTGIRVDSKEELTKRIYKYFDEWKYKMDTIDPRKEDVSKIVYEVVNAKAASIENKEKRSPEIKNLFEIYLLPNSGGVVGYVDRIWQ